MAKQKPENEKSPETTPRANGHESAGEPPEPDVDKSPRVRKAAAAVEKAKAELRKAQELYHEVCTEATQKLKAAREKTVGEFIDGGLKLVKKYPGPGVILAALVGFFLGRLFRR